MSTCESPMLADWYDDTGEKGSNLLWHGTSKQQAKTTCLNGLALAAFTIHTAKPQKQTVHPTRACGDKPSGTLTCPSTY